MAQQVKNLPAMQETQGTRDQSLGQEDPLEKEMATQSRILTWEIPWTEEPGGLVMGSQRIRHDWATEHTHNYPPNLPRMRGSASCLLTPFPLTRFPHDFVDQLQLLTIYCETSNVVGVRNIFWRTWSPSDLLESKNINLMMITWKYMQRDLIYPFNRYFHPIIHPFNRYF